MSRIGMIVFSNYPQDVRVRREAEALIEAGHNVDVVCLRGPDQSVNETVRGVGVSRINMRHERGGKGRYLLNYALFFLRVMVRITALNCQHRYNIIHVHNMPEFLVFAAIIPRLMGARIVLDLHDPMPEIFMTKFDRSGEDALIRWVVRIERWSIRFAHAVITTNEAFVERFVSRGCPRDKIRIVMNAPQDSVFESQDPVPHRKATGEPPVIMYNGSVVQRYGLDTAVEAMTHILKELPGARLEVYGQGEFLDEAKQLACDLGLEEATRFHGYTAIEDIVAAIDKSDIGIVPNHRNVFTEINFPTRIFEFICRHRPVIAPRTQGILDYFDDQSLLFFEPDSADDLARAVIQAWKDEKRREDVIARGYEVYACHKWTIEKQKLLALPEDLGVNS